MGFSIFGTRRPSLTDMRPYMMPEEIRLIESVLDAFPEGRDLRVFEYGSGGSTIYFPRYLRERERTYQWLSLEHDFEWAKQVLPLLNEDRLTGVQLLACEIPVYPPRIVNKRPRRVKLLAKGVRFDYSNYTDVPRRLGGCYDMILVDGRDRKNCLHTAVELLHPGGVVFFHDAERDYYQAAFARYPEGEHVLPRLWMYRKPG